ncbi:hypothetical protein HBH70_025790 [Parastagonospora nodorum]|nr:hypothetical protein HBH53_214160 [Parastagonospora nodorum]KAH3958298.1 hypothetical protein HBH51_212240 [Parastagonospora nodorum]KAH3992090.1 hypothetical protein HBI10_222170 [Parastagonospora nodorum]KAH4009636.1 hypothetical protein HBI13_217290 [Parastagonospora nodorum]KAH4043519.1 hypothetical protein HBH49_231380 [Parastagonospora nodorum]
MILPVKYVLSVFVASVAVSGQDAFEPANFNISEALIENGVDISTIAELPHSSARSPLRSCSSACKSLKVIFGNATVSSSSPKTYWSLQQSDVQSECTISPTTALQVSSTVLLSRLFQCPFAVKSGGHAAFAGASSINSGITIDLVNMKVRKLAEDKKTVAIGPGNRWLDVYDYLTPYSLVVVGGRAATVGVGGLTLGGGISHHTNEYGLACDNVASYDLVTASGKIINVSPQSYADLYWALRGGGNNFGIVTTFHYETLEQGLMFATKRQYNSTYVPALIDAFNNAVHGAENDTKLAHFVGLAYFSGMQIASTEYEYFTPVDPPNPPPILKEYLSIPPSQHETRNTTLASITPGLSESMPAGFRSTMWSQAFKLNAELMRRMSDDFFAIAPSVPGIAPSLGFQAFSVPALRAMQKKGGNALGLSPDDGPLFHVLFFVSWTDVKDDKVVMKAAQDFLKKAVEMAKELGVDSRYIYMPYSSPYQKVIEGYGLENVKRLNMVSRKYDPQRVFEKLQPGYFKLDGDAPYGELV